MADPAAIPHRPCEQRCSAPAEVYAIDPIPGGWGGYYCRPCASALRFRVIDVLGAFPSLAEQAGLPPGTTPEAAALVIVRRRYGRT